MNAMPALSTRARQTALLSVYGGRVPRYTSYPPATQFTPTVDDDVYAGWLSELPVDQPVSLYVHVPFCHRLCWFCGCHSRVVRREDSIHQYTGLLCEELALVEARLPAKLKATQIHFGGGTPNLLSVDDMSVLFGAMRQVFRVPDGAQIAAEIDPASLTPEWVRAAAFHGLSRASLGVQDLSPDVQAAVNRSESFETVAGAVGLLRAQGVDSVNFDLMYGLPRQTAAGIQQTLDRLLTLRPDRLALFGYAHVPWMKPHQKLIDEHELPGAEARLEQSESAAERLVAEGYIRIGLDHFALPDDSLARAAATGDMTRGFQGYSAGGPETLLGFGVSAIGQLPGGFVQNEASDLAWRTRIAGGRLAITRGVAASARDRLLGDVIKRLMCDFDVDLAETAAWRGEPGVVSSYQSEQLADLERDGLIVLEGSRIKVTPVGRPFVRSIAAVFDDYFAPAPARHAAAV